MRDGLLLVCPVCRAVVASEAGGVRCGACDRVYPDDEGILRLTAGRSGPPGYDPHFFTTLPAIEDVHFWFVSRRQVILDGLRQHVPDLARRRLFDIGCGAGGLLAFLERSGVPLAGGCDAYLEGLRLARRAIKAPLILVDDGRLPPLAPGQTLIGLFDVLEHIDDDVGTLAGIHSMLEPGGVVCLTVPAHPFLFDEMDRRAQHRRRYRRGELRQKLEAAGFEVRRLEHFMASLVPPLALLRKAAGLLHPAGRSVAGNAELQVVPGLNALLRAVLGGERMVGRLVPFPFGSSLLAVAVRRS